MHKKLTKEAALGRALQVLRIGRGLSGKEIATAMECDGSYISVLESGRRTPLVKTLRKFAELYEVPVGRIHDLAEEFETGKWEVWK